MLGVLHTYEYDGNGNITKETIGEGSSEKEITYSYDVHNRLIRCNDSRLGKTYVYTYDARGNITYIKEYAYTPSSSSVNGLTPVSSTPFSYGNTTWRDLLTNINGTTITYDSIGNPGNWTSGRTLIWEKGRQLSLLS
ncbi:MAG: hypothetical protein IKL36_01170 [Clostridia bacterium]|nr:hypothetical protein [Clostridia bacterium]